MSSGEDAHGPDDEADDRSDGEKKRLFERVVPEILKRVVERAVESGTAKLVEADNLRQFVGELKLPKEVLHYLYGQIDETKNGLYRAVAREIRDVLEHTQFADEITKVLTKLSFEIKTEIRFIPNDASKPRDGGGGETSGGQGGPLPKPDVHSRVTVREKGTEANQGRRRREDT